MISNIISVVNLIAIIILFILYFTKNNKENFTGTPSGYTDLLVSDPDGNLDTFSLSKLETDINTKISTQISNAIAVSESKATKKYQPVGSYIKSGQVISMTGYYKDRNQGVCRMLIGREDQVRPGSKEATASVGHGSAGKGCGLETGWFNQWVIN